MKYGLRESDLAYLVHFFESYPEITQVLLFGSRAMSNFKPGSDIDIALIASKSLAMELAGRLNESSPLPYHFDVVDYGQAQENLRKHIDRVGIIIYERKNNILDLK